MADAFKIKVRNKATRAEIIGSPWIGTAKNPYEAASTKPRVANWAPSAAGPNALLGGSLDLLRRRSRERRRNDGQADIIIDHIVTNAVGMAITPMFRTKDKDFNAELTGLFYDWTEEASADGDCDLYGQQALALSEALEAGEVFGRFRFREPGDMATVPLQIQVLESEFCPLDKNTVFDTGGARTIQGVEINGFGKRTAYWLHRQHPGDSYSLKVGSTQNPMSRVPAEEIMHLRQVTMKRAGTVRGTPWLTTALILLESMDKYNDAQVQRQQAATMFAGTIETDPALAQQFLQGMTDELSFDAYTPNMAPLTPMSMQFLNPGQKMTFTSPPSMGQDYAAFMREQNHRLAAAGRILYEQATGDYSGVNDRTWRAAMQDFRRRMRAIQWHMMIFLWCQPIINKWVDVGILAGKIKPPAGIKPADIKRVEHAADRWDYINPVQDIAAEIAEMEGGLDSRSNKVAERGDDIVRLDDQISADKAREKELGLIFKGTLLPPPAEPEQGFPPVSI